MAKKKEATKEVKKAETKESKILLPHQEHPLVCADKFKTYIYGKKYSVLSVQKYKHIFKTVFLRHRLLLIHMKLRNGKKTQFLVTPKKPYFDYLGGVYVIDPDVIMDDIGSGYPELIYHQDFSCPLSLDVDRARKYLEGSSNKDISDVWRNLNPAVLAETVMTSMIQKLQQVEEVGKIPMITMVLVIVNMIFTLMLMVSLGVMMYG